MIATLAGFSTSGDDIKKLGTIVLCAGLLAAIFVTTLTRVGLLATVAAVMFFFCLQRIPVSLDTSVWFWEQTSLPVILTIIALAGFGFATSYRGWASARQAETRSIQ